MPFVNRDSEGRVAGVSTEAAPGFEEELPAGDPDLAVFLTGLQEEESTLRQSDRDFVRVLEDLIEVLTDKGLILFTDLPEAAQAKLRRRRSLRDQLSRGLDLIGDD